MKPELIRKIGSGGFGVVYESYIVSLGQHVAVKFFSGEEGSSQERERFEREVRIQSKLQHPNILPVITHDLQANPPWFAMPLAKSTLAAEIEALQQQPDRVEPIFRQILLGMKYAHDKGVLHRDLKPQNILMFAGDQVKIADFGLGKRLDPDTFTLTLTYTHDILGTIYYAPPEQLKGLQYADFRADIYALGKMLYTVLTGDTPLDLDMDFVDARYQYIIDKCTKRKPEQRYQTIDALIEAFESVTGDETLFRRQKASSDMERLFAGQANANTITQLDRLFMHYAADETLYQTYFPKLQEGRFLLVYLKHNPDGFLRALQQFDQHISRDKLAYEYCDVVANLYRKVYQKLPTPDVRRLTLTRILDLGVRYNRFRVQNMFCKMLEQIDDQSTAFVALEVLRHNHHAVVQLRDKLLQKNLLNILHREIVTIAGK